MKQVEIVIPIYKLDYEPLEYKAFKNNLDKLKKHAVAIVCPDSLDTEKIDLFSHYDNIRIERFNKSYFANIDGYNALMLSSEFYERFLESEYMLICQTDAFVFRDELSSWCNKGYDYIGAPWIGSSTNLINKFLLSINTTIAKLKGKKPKNTERLFKVGNGGFSLRRVKIFHELSLTYKDLISEYRESKESDYHIEDVFWSLKIPKLESSFKIPDYKEAVAFAIDRKPDIALKINNNKLPFACHGFNKPKVERFWTAIIRENLGE